MGKAVCRRCGLPHRRAQLTVQCQVVSPKNIHTNNIIQTEQAIFRSIYLYTYMHAIEIGENRGHEFEEEWGGCIGGLGGRKGKKEML